MAATPTLKLTVEKGPREGECLEAKKNKSSVRIGRLVRGNDLAIKEDGISSSHLVLELNNPARTTWFLRDLNSSNGTILNHSPVTPDHPYPLSHGDSIKIGAYTVIKVHILPNSHAPAPDPDPDPAQPIPKNTRQTRGGRRLKALAEDRDADPGFSSKAVQSVDENRRITRSTARADGAGDAKVAAAPAAVETRAGGRKTRARGGAKGDDVPVGAAATVLEAPKRRGGRRPPKKALVVEKIEEEPEEGEEENVSSTRRGGGAAAASSGIEQISNLESKDQGRECDKEMGDLVPQETVPLSASGKGNLMDVPYIDMPLGEWFDYVERQLLKQIDEETEPIIEGMKLKAKRVAEYVMPSSGELQKNEK